VILEHGFTVAVPIAEAWQTMTDLEVVAPCLPGANLDRVDGDDYFGTIAVKIGAISARFAGSAHFVERDEKSHHAVLHADGRDQRGAGKATALITADLSDHDGATTVALLTDLKITGKVAQFGRGVLPDLSAKMIDQFAANLEATLAQGRASEARAKEPAAAQISTADLVSAAGPKRVVVAIAAFFALVLVVRRLLR
jgi:carbon monoxide dehydrogenase subunit G